MNSIFKIEYWCSADDFIWLELTEYTAERPKEVPVLEDLHHMLITELPLDFCLTDYDFLSQEVLLASGDTLVKRDYRNLADSREFLGRDEDELRFKVGDVVKYIDGDEFSIGVVYGLPPESQLPLS